MVGHNCINLRLPTHGGLYAWEFEKDGRELKVHLEGQLVFNGTFQMLNAALAGFGLAYVPEDVAQPHLAKGRLKRGLEDWSPSVFGLPRANRSSRRVSRAVAGPPTDRGCNIRRPFKEPPFTAESSGATRAALLAMRAHRGTGSSNPLPSSGESHANLTSSPCRIARACGVRCVTGRGVREGQEFLDAGLGPCSAGDPRHVVRPMRVAKPTRRDRGRCAH